jgi:hypothetical protein
MDRHSSGAFDVLRTYGNLGAVLRNLLGWRGCRGCSSAAHMQTERDTASGLHGRSVTAKGEVAHSASGGCDVRSPAAVAGQGRSEAQEDWDESEKSDNSSVMWREAQCGVFCAVNENLANMIPVVPVVLGAGGLAVQIPAPAIQTPPPGVVETSAQVPTAGSTTNGTPAVHLKDAGGGVQSSPPQGTIGGVEWVPLVGRRLQEGRCSVLYAANAELLQAMAKVVRGALTEAGKTTLC